MQDIIADIFDFGDTLALHSTSSFLEHRGVNVASFWKNKGQPFLDEGWSPVPTYPYMKIRESRSGRKEPVTVQQLSRWGK